MVLGRNSRGGGYAGQRRAVAGTTELRIDGITEASPDYRLQTTDYRLQTTDRAVAGGAVQELRNYGTTDRVSRLKAQSLSMPSILSILSIPFYTLYTHSSKKQQRIWNIQK